MKPAGPVAVVLTAVTLHIGGCSPSQVINTGGDTPCRDFTGQDDAKQSEEIAKMLRDSSGVDPNNLEISATRLSVLTYCRTLGRPDSKISEAPHG